MTEFITAGFLERGPTPKLLKRQLNAIHRDTAVELGEHWHKEFRPKHFTSRGASEYGYQPRGGERGSNQPFKGSYTARKLKKLGHTRPLVYTGRSEGLAAIRDIRATAKKGAATARVVIHARGLNFRSSARSPDMRKEITTISQAEAAELTQLANRRLQARFAAVAGEEKTAIE